MGLLPFRASGAQCTTRREATALVHHAPPSDGYVPPVDDTWSPLRAYVELKIGADVCHWIEEQREAEPNLGRRPLARRLGELVGRRIDPVTLTRWCPGSFQEDG